MKQLPIADLKGSSYVRVSLYRLLVSSVFSGRAGFDVDASHIFPQGVLANITLVFGRTGDEGGRAGTWCEGRLTLCSVAVTGLLVVGSESQVAGA